MNSWIIDKHSKHSALMFRTTKILYEKKTPFQKIKVVDTPDYGKVLMLDGIIMLSDRDHYFYHEMMTHVPMYCHPRPRDVLIIGGGDGGIATEVLRHDCVRDLSVVEIDPGIPLICEKYFPNIARGLKNKRCKLIIDDGSRFVQKSESNSYDVIIIDSTDPSNLSRVLFTQKFHNVCYNLLKKDGILIQQIASPFYSPNAIKKSYNISQGIFKLSRFYTVYAPTYSNGLFLILLSSKKYDPLKTFHNSRFRTDDFQLNYYNEEIHQASFVLPSYLRKFIRV